MEGTILNNYPGFYEASRRRKIFLYHLKAYLYGFILSRDSKFSGAPFMAKMALNPKEDLELT